MKNRIQMGNHWSEKIRRYLQSPYPVVYQRWKVVLISSLVVFLILLVLQPFGISGIEGHKFWILLGFMGVTAVLQRRGVDCMETDSQSVDGNLIYCCR